MVNATKKRGVGEGDKGAKSEISTDTGAKRERKVTNFGKVKKR